MWIVYSVVYKQASKQASRMKKRQARHELLNLPRVGIQVSNSNNFRVRGVNVWHLSGIIKGLVSSADEPSVFVHAHDIVVASIDNVFHRKLVTELVRVRVSIGGVYREGNPDKGKAIVFTVAVVIIVGGRLSTLTVLSVYGTETFCPVALVVIATS